jgi:glyoxylase I family protein
VAWQRLSAETRREQLEQAAIVVVADEGHAAVNADAIARIAGTSKGLLWHYYTDLDDLLVHAARRALRVMEAAVAADLDLTAELPELLRGAIGRAATLPATHGRELRAIRHLVDNLRGPDGRPLLRDSKPTPPSESRLVAGASPHGHASRPRSNARPSGRRWCASSRCTRSTPTRPTARSRSYCSRPRTEPSTRRCRDLASPRHEQHETQGVELMPIKLENVAIAVRDLEATIAFFTDLGLTVIGRDTVSGEWTDTAVGLDGNHAKIAILQTPDGNGQLELFEYIHPDAIETSPTQPNEIGMHRIAFSVDNIDEALTIAARHGCHPLRGVATYNDVYKLTYVRGPSGILVMFAEELNKSSSTASPTQRAH